MENVLLELPVKSIVQVLATSNVIVAVHAVVNVAVSCISGTRELQVEPDQVVQLTQLLVTGAGNITQEFHPQSQHNQVTQDKSNGAQGQVKFKSIKSKYAQLNVHHT
jgi:hypothetical protein